MDHVNASLPGAPDSAEIRFAIVSSHVLEAEDITECLTGAGYTGLWASRNAAELAIRLRDPGFQPQMAFLSGREPLALAPAFEGRTSRLVMIDGDAAEAKRLGASVLERPYTSHQLEVAIARMLGDG